MFKATNFRDWMEEIYTYNRKKRVSVIQGGGVSQLGTQISLFFLTTIIAVLPSVIGTEQSVSVQRLLEGTLSQS
jgi:hypothetical protein